MFSTEHLTEEAVGLLDEKLHYVITNSGWPSWGIHGSSTGLLGWRLEFGVDCLQDCARIDFHRCGGGDDILNTQWAAWFHLLPTYQSLKECYDVRTVSTEVHCMQTVVGISYVSFTYGIRRLPDTGKLYFASPVACADWAGLWPMFQALGIKAMQQAPAPPPLPKAAPAWPRAAPASAASTLERLTQATVDLAHVAPAECRGQLGGGRGLSGCRCRAPLLAFRSRAFSSAAWAASTY